MTFRIPYRFRCGCSIPNGGIRYRTRWPLAVLLIDDVELRVRGRGVLSRLGSEPLPTQDVASAQAMTGRFGRGVFIDVRAGTPWCIFTFRPDEVLRALKEVGIEIIAGSRRVGFRDEI